MDDEKHEKYMREMFEYEERTEHRGVIPARDRIKQFKTRKVFDGRNITSAIKGPTTAIGMPRSKMTGAKSAATFNKVAPHSTKAGGLRPTTAAVSHFG
jgi:hypothetical protein